MTKFESELRNGQFVISECNKCKKIVWPTNDFCSTCFSQNNWRRINPLGEIIEFSKKDGDYFGLIELEGKIRIMGVLKISQDMIKIGQCVKLDRCYYNDGPIFTFTKCGN